MRSILILIISTFILQSCRSYRTHAYQEADYLAAVIFPAHDNDVELFFADETSPEKDYVRLAILEEKRLASSSASRHSLPALEKRAQEVGADALIVLGVENIEEIEECLTDEDYYDSYTVNYEYTWGVAIRYLDNLTSGEAVISHWTVTTSGDIASDSGGVVDVNPLGGVDQKPPGDWTKFVYHHSLEYLLDHKKGWVYTSVLPNDGYASTVLRRHKYGSSEGTRLKVNYSPQKRVESLVVQKIRGDYVGIKMTLQYDDQGRIVGREWVDYRKQRFVTQCIFDTDNKLVREDIQRQRKGEDLRAFLSVEYHYFTEEELLASLDKEQIIRVEP
ncbi:MAG: hypothetical protein AAFN81_07910 [Bacteroidota bacterium]